MAVTFIDCQKEYSKNKELKEGDVKALLEWATKQPHLPPINEQQAILFLQSCYFRNELAKTALDTFFTVRTLCPDLFQNLNPTVSPLKEGLNVCLFTALPKQTPEGYTIFLIKIVDGNADNYNMACQVKYFDMMCMNHLHQQHGTSNGHMLAVDMNGMTFGHLTKFNPLVMKKFFYYLQEAMPVRLKGFHYFNISPLVDKLLAIIKPFMKKELLDVLHLHNSLDDMAKFIPKECLPSDYGGSCDSIAVLHEKTKKELVECCKFFEWEDKNLVDESKRPGKPKNAGDFFGVEGTFKKLELD